MAIQTITYTDKVALNENPNVAEINKVTDDNMNEIKSVVNNNAAETSTNTTNITTNTTKITNLQKYSTNETNTGQIWINGKPIYRKVVDLGSLGSQTQISYGNQIDTITSFSGYIYQDNGGNMSLIEYTSSLWRAITYTITSRHTMNVLINRSNTSAWSDWKLKIVIEYTKTTD